MKNSNFPDRLRAAIDMNGIRQADLCRMTQISKSAMSQYLSGAFLPKQRNIYALAQALHVSEPWLMGYDVPMARKPRQDAEPDHEPVGLLPDVAGAERSGDADADAMSVTAMAAMWAAKPRSASMLAEAAPEIGTDASFYYLVEDDSLINVHVCPGARVLVEAGRAPVSQDFVVFRAVVGADAAAESVQSATGSAGAADTAQAVTGMTGTADAMDVITVATDEDGAAGSAANSRMAGAAISDAQGTQAGAVADGKGTVEVAADGAHKATSATAQVIRTAADAVEVAAATESVVKVEMAAATAEPIRSAVQPAADGNEPAAVLSDETPAECDAVSPAGGTAAETSKTGAETDETVVEVISVDQDEKSGANAISGLRRYVRRGDVILLLAENSNYDPLMYRAEDLATGRLTILGVARRVTFDL